MTYTDLTPGNYTIEVKDANDCTFAIPTTVEIEEGVTLNASLDIQTTCNTNTIGNVVFVLVNPDVQDDVEYSLDGGAFQDPLTAEFIDLADGSHTIIVRHENTCEQALNFTITSPDNITATASATANVLCYGGTDGVIEVTATGGTGTLLYSISDAIPPVFADYISSNVFSDLAAGTYTISVMDDNVGCETQLSVTITQPEATLAATLDYIDEICFDGNDGIITLNITGGVTPYQISLNGNAYETVTGTTHTFTSLADDTYTIDVKDANDCAIAQFTQVIQNGVNMQPSAVVTPNCVNNTPNNDVVINIAAGVTGTVTYSINGTDYFASNTFTNVGLAAGTYTAYAKHDNACVQTTAFTIDAHTPIDATAAVTENVLCFGAATGEITVTATGGTTPLQYAISPAYVYGSSNVFTGLEAGTYDVKVKDAISCEVTTTSVTVTQPAAALAATLAHTDEICFDGNDGTLTVNITGGTIPYEVSINEGEYTTATVYAALPDGTYTIDVKDANDCAIAQLTQVIQNGVNIQPSAVVTPNCVNNAPNNDVLVNIAAGVTGTVTYSINGTDYFTSNTFTNVGLPAGTYTAYAKHANGCVQIDEFIIINHTPLMHTGTSTLNITCYGNDTGEATLSVSGGTAPVQYAMAPLYVYQDSNLFTGLAPGTYDFKVKDAIGCEIEVNDVTITEPFGPLAADVIHTDETCFDSNDGSITVSITGGTPPYFTSLDGGPFIQDQTAYTDLADGTHTINVTDAFACTIPQQSVVIVNGVNMQPVATVNPNCVNNTPNNDVVITIASGIPASDIMYSIDGGAYQPSGTFNNVDLPAGDYVASVEHSNGCIQTVPFTIAPHAPVTANVANIVHVLCFDETTGQITVTASGGTNPLEYAIANEDTTPLQFSAYQPSAVFENLAAGMYTISVKDAIGCEVLLSGNQVDGPAAALVASATPTHESCINDDDGQIDITISGGTAPYATSLNGAAYVDGQLSYAGLDGGTYTVDVTDANGCHIGAPIAVTINDGVQLQASLNVTQVCEDVQVVVSVNPTSTGTVTYTLDGVYTQSSNTFNSTVTPMAAGQHTIAVTHSAGCTEELLFNVAPRAAITISYTKTDVSCNGTDTGVVNVNATGGTGALQYALTWDIWPTPIYGTDTSFDELLGDKDYTIWVKDAMGCVETTTLRINQPAEKLLIASTAVRPETCILDRNGGIDITITGGTPPYLTALNSPTPNNFQPVTSYNNLIGGVYDVYVMDAAGCYVKTTVTVESGVNLDPYVETVMSCDNNVPVNTVTVKLRLTLSDVTYSLSPAGPFTANNVFEVPSGQHTVYVRHKNGCEVAYPFTIQDRLPVTAQAASVAAKCNGEANGTITVTASGGTGAFKYAIADASVSPVVFGNLQNSNVFTGLAASNAYIIRVQDAYGCFTEVGGIIVSQPDAIVLSTPVIIQEEICVNDNDAAIELANPTGGTAPYATSLNAAGPFVTDQYLFDNLDGGKTYTIYVQDANGCIANTSVTLAAPMDINASARVDYNCEENTVTVLTNNNIPVSQLTYIISGPKGNYPPQTTNVYANLEDGKYVVEVINTVTGCSDTTEQFTIESAPALALSVIKWGLNQITATAVGGSGLYRYTFDGNDTGTKNTFTYYRTGRILVTVTDSRGCITEAFIDAVFVDIIIPDVMTPDGDGQNDTWSPGNTQNYPNINTDIFDRYGRKLATLRQGQVWDGKYDGNEMPTGDYWYLVKLGDAEDRDFVGHFTIYR
ncbi:hypothetical protein AMR72_08915 [Flavobacterium psychrophilum]|nr:hypothetical protein AMR72_08915 [Flavobacterium psychrophilum]AOE52616.1 hypothetical protein ALW18_08905 [Flavobacterium psychrophilum]